MTTVTIEEAQANLKELIHRMTPGDELIITENQQTIAKVVTQTSSESKLRPPPGAWQRFNKHRFRR